jgi:hypothetical protein
MMLGIPEESCAKNPWQKSACFDTFLAEPQKRAFVHVAASDTLGSNLPFAAF